ncbi:MAG: 2-isopropylmalate synthase [SAR324 cluster bacterium]|nr:2-isopropylmalate synthase [SAR324 cluster bacterium]
MKTMPIENYRPYPKVELSNRQWPSNIIDLAPIWCSVDLRDGNQALSNPMTIEQKLEIFNLLVALGFKEIEIGFPAAADVEFAFLRKLVEDHLIPEDVTIQVLTQTRAHLIEKTFEAIQGVPRAIVHLYNSTSTVQRRVVFDSNRKGIIGIAVEGAELAHACAKSLQGTKIMFQYSPESFTGTELDFAVEICEAVMGVWQPTSDEPVILNLPATVEMSTPNIFADQIEWFGKHLQNREAVILSVHTHNDRGTGVAASELALMAGAQRVEGTLFGNGERTGNLDIVTMALNMFSQGVDPKLDFSDIQKIVAVYEQCTGMFVHPRHPYAGDLVYTAFSGSHQDAIRKGMLAHKKQESTNWEVPYLPINPQDVGRTYESIIRINSQSGKGGVAYVMEQEFGYQLPKAMHSEFAEVIQHVSEKTGEEVSSSVIARCFHEEYLLLNQPMVLNNCQIHTTSSNTDSLVTTKVCALIQVDHQEQSFIGTGNGPIDAFCNAIRKNQDIDFKLVSYHEHALEEGSSAHAVAYVQIESGEKKYFGVGKDTNISLASIKSVLSAVNRAFAAEDKKEGTVTQAA